MAGYFENITIRYDGLDADGHAIDLGLLGESLKGASRLIAVSGHLVLTGTYVSRLPALSVRVLADASPQAKCFEISTVLSTTVPLLPLLSDAGRIATKKALEAAVNYILAKLGGNKKEADKAMDVALAAIESNKAVSLKGLDLASQIVRASENLRPAAAMFAAPVGPSVGVARIGTTETAFPVDAQARALIEAKEKETIEASREFIVQISELDVTTGAAKVRFTNDPAGPRRGALIVDPVVHNPHNPYSAALDSQEWITVIAKPHVQDGAISKITITDTKI